MRKGWVGFVVLVIIAAIALIGLRVFVFAPGSSAQKPVVIRLSGGSASPTEAALLQSVLQDFETLHPNINVKYEVIADEYMDVIKTRLIGEAAPDVFYLDVSEAPFLISKDVLEPLDSYITADFDLADFEPSLLNLFKDQGRIYGLPKDYSTLALFYNKQAFAAAGLTDPPQTWEELSQYAQQLNLDADQDGRIEQYGIGIMPELARQVYKIEAFGGQLVDPDGHAAFATDKGGKGLKLLVDQYRQDRSSAQPSDVGNAFAAEMFGQEKAAMVISGNWAIPYLAETFPKVEFGVAELPRINNQPRTMVYTVAYVMNKQAEHKTEAWELIAYLTGKEGMKNWTSNGLALPTRKSVGATLGYDQDPLRAALVAGVNYATPWQGGEHLSVITNSFNNQFLSALLGEQSLKQAMVKAQKSANRQIKANE